MPPTGPGEAEATTRNLLNATEAGAWAERAGARRLLLTHSWPGADPVRSIEQASQAFAGPIQVAGPGLIIDLDH